MPSNSYKCKLRKLKSIFPQSVGGGGGSCGCGPSATDVVEPTPKPNPSLSHQNPNQSSKDVASSESVHVGGGRKSVAEDHTSTTDTSPSPTAPHCCPLHATTSPRTVIAAACPKIHDSLAVVQDSDDPHRDFRRSMLQMIFENEIYSRNDLQQLLDCFLQLNSPLHHQVIFRAFMEIWNGDVFAEGGGGGDAAEPVFPVGSGDGLHVKTLNPKVG